MTSTPRRRRVPRTPSPHPSATTRRRARARTTASVTAVALAASGLAGVTLAAFAAPAAGADERTLALVGDLQSELGCPADWDPACAATELAPTDTAGVWSADFEVPAGAYEYKVAYDDAWDEAYGREGSQDNAPLVLGGDATVRVTFDESTHRIALTPLGLAGGYDEAQDADLVVPPVRQPGSDERFYFVMTDRFANGDPSNDTAGLGDDPLVSGFDPTNKGFYQGGDIAGLRQNLDYVEGLGTTAICSRRRSRTSRSRARAPTRRRATTATGSPTSRRSTRTSAPTPSSRRSSTRRTTAGSRSTSTSSRTTRPT